MRKAVKYEYDSNKKRTVILFKGGYKVEDEKTFCKSHYFVDSDNGIITTIFKDELLDLFSVENVDDLKERINNNVKLLFKSGIGKMNYNELTNTVEVYTESFRNEVVKPTESIKKLKKNIEKLSKNEKVTSGEYTNLVTTIVNGITDIEFTENDKKRIAKLIPQMIRNGEVKISLRDITDINKDRLKDIVEIGRNLLNKSKGVEKKLGISREFVGKEYAWQKYFELYGTYLLFGSIKQQKTEEWLNIESRIRAVDSRLDILTINRYGFLDIVELKKSDDVLFKLDASHDNIVPTSKLSTAISQVNNYLMLLPYSGKHGDMMKGAESATGMLVIGSNNTLMQKENIEKYAKKNNISKKDVNLKIKKALRDLNYSYSHIQIVLYDEILDNLDNFINQMEIKIN